MKTFFKAASIAAAAMLVVGINALLCAMVSGWVAVLVVSACAAGIVVWYEILPTRREKVATVRHQADLYRALWRPRLVAQVEEGEIVVPFTPEVGAFSFQRDVKRWEDREAKATAQEAAWNEREVEMWTKAEAELQAREESTRMAKAKEEELAILKVIGVDVDTYNQQSFTAAEWTDMIFDSLIHEMMEKEKEVEKNRWTAYQPAPRQSRKKTRKERQLA